MTQTESEEEFLASIREFDLQTTNPADKPGELLTPRLRQAQMQLDEVREQIEEDPTIRLMENQAGLERAIHAMKTQRLLLKLMSKKDKVRKLKKIIAEHEELKSLDTLSSESEDEE